MNLFAIILLQNKPKFLKMTYKYMKNVFEKSSRRYDEYEILLQEQFMIRSSSLETIF